MLRDPPNLPPELSELSVVAPKQYADMTRTSERHVRRLIASGAIPTVQISERRIGIPMKWVRSRLSGAA